MRKLLLKLLGVYRKKHLVESEILEKLLLINLSGNDLDNVTEIVVDAFDKYFD